MVNRSVREIPGKSIHLLHSTPLKVCAYVRVSTHHTEQAISLENQTEYYMHKFSAQPHFEFVGIFSDAGISGAKANRPGFKTMIEKAKLREIDVIYTKSISRFARNTLLLLQTVRGLRSIGVGIVFEDQNINTLSAEGELMLSILAGIAEEERKSVSSNTKWSIQKRYMRGDPMINAEKLLGYDKDESGGLVINPKQADVVRRIFRMYLEGLNACEITLILNDENIPTYSAGPWVDSRILSFISNEKYKGSCLMQKSFVDENGKQIRNRGERDQYFVHKSHPKIVSKGDWDKAQEIRQARARKSYPYSGLLRCAFCGSSLIRVKHSGGYVSWICYKYLSKGKAACVGSRISEPLLYELTKAAPLTEPVIVEEVKHESSKKSRKEKNYRFAPVSANTSNPVQSR